VIEVILYIRYKNLFETQWIGHVLDEWRIKLEDPSIEQELMTIIRGQILHHIMDIKKQSSFVPYKNDLLVPYKCWTGLHVLRNNRGLYNPTWSALHGVVLARNDNMTDMWNSQCYYDLAFADINQLNGMPEISPKCTEHTAFIFNSNGSDETKKCAASRNETTVSTPIFEDLRFSVEWRAHFDPDTLPLITGVSLFSGRRTKFCVMTGTITGVKSAAPSLRWVHDLASPTNAKHERNWLFVQRRNDPRIYNMIYSIQPLAIYQYSMDTRLILEGSRVEVPLTIPVQWKNDIFSKIPNVTEYRLNAIALVHNETELMLLIHRKEYSLPFYVNYCLYLDPHTFRPLFYIPFPIMTEVAARIVFPMSIVCTDRYYHISCGIMDEVAGILTYEVDKWEKSRIAFD